MKKALRRPLAAGVATLVILHSEALLLAQQDPPPAKLSIVIVEGDGAINTIRQRIAREPIVQVEDENRRPVAGAVVLFTAPRQGPSATFPGNSATLRVTTDAQGRATASGLRANAKKGSYQIAVEAVSAGLTARAMIRQENNKGAGMSLSKLAIIGGAVAIAVVVVVVVAVTRGGDNATVLVPGAPTVGGR
jgi:hypothetical protein